MKVLVGIDRRGGPILLNALNHLLPLAGQEVVLAHVIDNGMRGELQLTRGRLLPRHLPPHHLRAITEAEREAAEAALNEASRAAEMLRAIPYPVLAEGEPGRVLSRLVAEEGCHLAVVAARSGKRPEPPGPRSVGHTARFVLDHCPRPVLLLRGSLQVTGGGPTPGLGRAEA
jgi:nucleotide-binding universal stress UspA family protein